MTTTGATRSEMQPLTTEEMATIRSKVEGIFQELQQSVDFNASSNPPPSWIRPETDVDWIQEQRTDHGRYFDTHGFLLVPSFCDSTEIQLLKDQMKHLANHDWDPNREMDTFGTDSKSNTARGDYFLDSSNCVHYFAEPQALDEQKKLRPEYEADKLAALNKAGHGMHIIPGAFQDYTRSSKVLKLIQDLGWQDPVVPQSMYIFKQPKIGGTVHSHQDSSFLYTTPRQTCLGMWLALDDATLENGCLWVRPGSHREPLRRQFVRNPEYFEKNDWSAPKLIFEYPNVNENPQIPWEGALPDDQSLLNAGFVPVECKAGDLVTFAGLLDHLSLPNFSDMPRHTFQLHLVEGPKAGVTWSPKNWLQYAPGKPFMALKQAQGG